MPAAELTPDSHRTLRLLVLTLISCALVVAATLAAWRLRTGWMLRTALVDGNAAYVRADWDTARHMLGRYLSAHPDDGEVLAKFAHAQLSVRPVVGANLRQAIAAYRQLLRYQPEDEHAFHELTRLYDRYGNFAALLTVAENRLRVCPADPAAMLARAKANSRLGHEETARTELTSLAQSLLAQLSRGPEFVDVAALLADLSAQAANPSDPNQPGAQALLWLDEAVTHCPTSSLAWVHRAALRRSRAPAWPAAAHQAALAAARDDLEHAEQLPADDPRTHLLLCQEWLAHRLTDRAAAQLEAAKCVEPAVVQRFYIDPDDWVADLFAQTANVARATGSADAGAHSALAALEQLRDRPQRFEILPDAIELLADAHQVEAAQACLAEYLDAAKLEPNTADREFQAAYLRALVARADEYPYLVIQCLQPVHDRQATRWPFQALLAEAYLRTGQLGRAELTSPTLQDVRARPDIYRSLARTGLQHAAWSLAQTVLEPLVAAFTDDIDTRIMLLIAKTGRAGEAAAAGNPRAFDSIMAELAGLQAVAPQRPELGVLRATLDAWEGRLDDSLSVLRDTIAKCDDHWMARLALARLHSDASHFTEACDVLRAACQQHPTEAAPWQALADLQTRRHELDDARATLTAASTAVTNRDQQWQITVRRAVLEITNGDLSLGVSTLYALARSAPRDVSVRALLLDLPQVIRDQSAAQKLVDEIRDIEGDDGLLWRLHQARIWLAAEGGQQHNREIDDLLRHCIGTDPHWAQPVLVLGEAYEQVGRHPEAEELYRQSFEANGEPEVAERLLTLLQAEQRYAEARRLLEHLRPGLDERALNMRRLPLTLCTGQSGDPSHELELRAVGQQESLMDSVRLAGLLYMQNGDATWALAQLDEAQACGADPVTVTRTRVLILKDQRRQAEAEDALNQLVAAQPSPDAFLLRAWYHAGTQQVALAEQDYIELAHTAHDALGSVVLGEFYAEAQRLDDAIRTWEEGLERYPASVPLRRGLAKALLQRSETGDRDRARALLTELRRQLPNDTDLIWAQAVERASESTSAATNAARGLLREAVDAAPAGPEAYRGLAELGLELGEYATARALALRGLQAHAADRNLVLLQSQAELALQDYDMARALAASVLATGVPDSTAHAVLVDAAIRCGDQDSLRQELATITTVLGADPNSEAFQVLRGRAQTALGQTQGAIQNLAAYLATDAGRASIPVLFALQDALRVNGDFAAARDRLAEIDSLAPQHSETPRARLVLLTDEGRYDEIVRSMDAESRSAHPRADLLVLAAQLLARLPAHYEPAVAFCRRAIDIAPDDARAQRVLGELAYEHHDAALAEQAFRASLRIAEDQAEVLNNLAWVLAQRPADFSAALAYARDAVALRPTDANFRDTLATVLLRLGKLDEAQAEFQRCVELAPTGSPARAKALLQLAQVCDKLADRTPIAGYVREALATDEAQAIFSPAERSTLAHLLHASRPERAAQ